jgi:hypothetical protein
LKNNLFIGDDGAVIEIHDDATDVKKKRKAGKGNDVPRNSPKRKEKTKLIACGECEGKPHAHTFISVTSIILVLNLSKPMIRLFDEGL